MTNTTFRDRLVCCVLFMVLSAMPAIAQLDDPDEEHDTPIHEYNVTWSNTDGDADVVTDAVGWDVYNALDPTHELYLDLDFREPYWSTDTKHVWFEADVDDTAVAGPSKIKFRSSKAKDMDEATLRLIALHEMFHHEQYAYIDRFDQDLWDDWGKWVTEGTARLIQDKLYTDLDLSTSVAQTACYYGEIKEYLDDPNRTIMDISYTAA